MNTKHKNYGAIIAFINGEKIQYQMPSGKWVDIEHLKDLDFIMNYRIKPKTKTINGFEVPAPLDKQPELNTEYCIVDVNDHELYRQYRYTCDYDKLQLDRGLAFSNKEDAIKTAKAMLGIDPNS